MNGRVSTSLLIALASSAFVLGCSESGQPLEAEERMKLEQDRQRAEDDYAETLGRLRRFERLKLDRELAVAEQREAGLAGRLAAAERTLAGLEQQRKELLAGIDVKPSATQADWAEQVAAVRLMLRQAEEDRAGIEGDLVRAREALAELRQLLAQRDILMRQALEQEKLLLELNRKLQAVRSAG